MRVLAGYRREVTIEQQLLSREAARPVALGAFDEAEAAFPILIGRHPDKRAGE